jgi:hypothetical protein
MITEEEVFTIGPTEAENQESETTRVCRICKESLSMEDFYKSIDCIGGRERTCKKCQAVRKRITAESKKSGVKISTGKIKAEPPRLPIGLPPGVTIISTPDITDDDMSINIDFTKYPDLLVSVEDAAKREFRTPAMQILFMLSKFNDV